MKMYDKKGKRIDGIFQFDCKGYVVTIKSFVKPVGNPEAIVEKNGQQKGDDPFMYDENNAKIETIESVLNWIDEDIKLAEKEKQDENYTCEILQHTISYFFRETRLKINGSGIEHIENMIKQGYRQGELNEYLDTDNPKEGYRGWWSISKDA